jgi:hypothetical protein
MESMYSQKRTFGLTSGYERSLQHSLVLEDFAVVPLTSMLQITLTFYSLESQPVAADLCSDSGHEGLKNTHGNTNGFCRACIVFTGMQLIVF